jgi:hypothetical protein
MKIQLSDDTAGAVVGMSAKDPYRPIVKRFAADGWTLEGDAIDLSGTGRRLYVSHAGGVAVEPFLPGAPGSAAPARAQLEPALH